MAFGDYKIGDRGAGVTDLQNKLNSLGFDIAVDGQFGAETQGAVRAFQTARGIAVDGIAGPETLIEMSRATGEGWQIPPEMASVVARGGRVTPAGPSTTIVPGTPGAPTSPMMGLFILVGLAAAIWFFTGRKGKR